MASNHQLPAGKAEHALALIRERYTDFGPTLASEKLHESHGIEMSVETVRTLMIAAGLWIPRSQRAPKVYQPRDRRACTGELVQIDGSEHARFEDRAPACTLLVYVDDATSRLMVLHFTATESTFSCFEATRAYLERYGKPVASYSDRASVFRPVYSRTGARGITQFGRAMYELNIEIWFANSSPAKGRRARPPHAAGPPGEGTAAAASAPSRPPTRTHPPLWLPTTHASRSRPGARLTRTGRCATTRISTRSLRGG